uniref:Putative secreted protein n=1 Tax=Anopheles marajoara TaxID=58244 RepID=A0A2M4CBN7_9DIPT
MMICGVHGGGSGALTVPVLCVCVTWQAPAGSSLLQNRIPIERLRLSLCQNGSISSSSSSAGTLERTNLPPRNINSRTERGG